MKRSKIVITITLCVAIFSYCSPFQQVQRSEKMDSVTTDNSTAEQHTENSYHGEGVFTQTVIEYYPPGYMGEQPEQGDLIGSAESSTANISQSTRSANPAVRRIVVTRIEAKAEGHETRDSVVHNDTGTHLQTETAEKSIEKPHASVLWLKWAAIALVALLLIVVLLKLKPFRK